MAEAIPTEEELALKPNEFRLAASFLHHLLIGTSRADVASQPMNTTLLHGSLGAVLCGSMTKL